MNKCTKQSFVAIKTETAEERSLSSAFSFNWWRCRDSLGSVDVTYSTSYTYNITPLFINYLRFHTVYNVLQCFPLYSLWMGTIWALVFFIFYSSSSHPFQLLSLSLLINQHIFSHVIYINVIILLTPCDI